MSDISVLPMGARKFAVQAGEGCVVTSHVVTVPDDLTDDLQIGDDEHERLVRESFEFLLEREPTTSIAEHFTLTDISAWFPEYRDEIPRRLG